MTRSVFVGNIPYEATEEKLKDIFSQAGSVGGFLRIKMLLVLIFNNHSSSSYSTKFNFFLLKTTLSFGFYIFSFFLSASFKLVYDRETGKPKGYGFCEYKVGKLFKDELEF